MHFVVVNEKAHLDPDSKFKERFNITAPQPFSTSPGIDTAQTQDGESPTE